MVLISSKKYACETCIKGHRSSTCKHTDRPLYEIKKKGRPVTQCEHCRELRKTKQVHVKCICEVKTETITTAQPCSNGKKGTKIPPCAAFPNGLPQELEAAISSQFQEGSTLDPRHGVKEQGSCSCKSGGPCVCCTTRHARRNTVSDIRPASLQTTCDEAPIPAGQPQTRLSMSHILARVKELRPVLPRPASSNSSGCGPVHDLSLGIPHTHPNRHHMHDHVMFSPYGRAHDRTHDYPLGYEKHHPPLPLKGESYCDQPMLELGASAAQPTPHDTFPFGNFPSMSACGCAGCEPNKGCPNADMNCTGYECQSFIPSPAAVNSVQRGAIDEWLRQVSPPQPSLGSVAFQQGIFQQECPSAQRSRINSFSDSAVSAWIRAALPSFNHNGQPSGSSDDGRTHASTPEFCGNQCSCPPQACQCKERTHFCKGESYQRMTGDDERFSQLQMSPVMSRSDTHLVLPDLYQTRPFSTPLQRSLGVLRHGISNAAALPYALDGIVDAEYMTNSQSVVQALLDFPVTSTTSPNPGMPWISGGDGMNLTSGLMPTMYPYAMSSSGTDGTSSYEDLSTTLRTPL